MTTSSKTAVWSLAVRVGVFAFLEIAGLMLLGPLMEPVAGYMAAAALSTFAAAGIANAYSLRIYERATLADVGLGWTRASARHFGLGFAGGAGGALVIAGLPLAAGWAELAPSPEYPRTWGGIFFVSLVLLFGAVGEEMLFRGYGFQVLLARLGKFATILPLSILFGVAHASNQNASMLGLVNTTAWGVLFAFAFLRSGDLWLPIGLHYGWNVLLPLFGMNLSGFTMGVTGYLMKWKASEWVSGGAYGPEGSILTSIVVAILFWLLYRAPIERHVPFLLRDAEDVLE